MSFPFEILTSSHGKSFEELGKKYKAAYKKFLKTRKQTATGKGLRSDVMKWIFNCGMDERINFLSIHSKWLVREIYRLSQIYNSNKNVQFRLRSSLYSDENSKGLLNSNVLSKDKVLIFPDNHQSYEFFSVINHINEESDSTIKENFLSHIKVFSVEEINDTLTFSKDLLKDEKSFEQFFFLFSGAKHFADFPSPCSNRKYSKVTNLSFPRWFEVKDQFSLFEIIIAYFEQIIMVNYLLFKQDIYSYNVRIINILRKNDEMMTFLKKKDKKEIFRLLKLIKIQENKGMGECKDKNLNVNGSNTLSDLSSAMTRLKWFYYEYNEEKFINHLFFVDLISLDRVESLVFREAYEMLDHLYSDQIANELLSEEQSNKNKIYSVNTNYYEKLKETKVKVEDLSNKHFVSNYSFQIVKELLTEIINKSLYFTVHVPTVRSSTTSDLNYDINTTEKVRTDIEKEALILEFHHKERNSHTPINDNSIAVTSKNNIIPEIKKIDLDTDIIDQDYSTKPNHHVIKTEIKIINQITFMTNPRRKLYKERKSNRIPKHGGEYYYKKFTPLSYTEQHNNSYLFDYPHYFYDPVHNFYEKFHYEIISYTQKTLDVLNFLSSYRECVICKVKDIIKETFQGYNIKIFHYGSYATNLQIESSDIDIGVKYERNKFSISNNSELNFMITALVKNFNKSHLFEVINPVYSATVPVLKLIADMSTLDICEFNEKFKFSNFYSSYQFDYSELDKIKIDITLNEHFNIPLPSEIAVEIVKNFLIVYPEIKPLLLVMKRFLRQSRLNNSFNGGLSSYATFLLFLAYIKVYRTSATSLGCLLVNFIEFYSNFNFYSCGVDINNFYPFINIPSKQDIIPLILDPVTYLNVSKSTYRINEIQKSFTELYGFIQERCLTPCNNRRILDQIFSLSIRI